jgi:uncharacterized membrane protein
MSTLIIPVPGGTYYTSTQKRSNRIESIDLLRGIVMIIMALDHVRDYFHRDAFLYSPTDLSQTSVFLFFTRFITHYCAPVFVFLAGISAYLYGANKSRRQTAWYLFTRGLWLIFTELFILSLGRTFNPSFPFFNLQVIWAIGISMIVLSAMIYMRRRFILLIAIILIAAHNLLDNLHIQNSFLWSFLHEGGDFVINNFHISVHYPVLPWIGIIALGYYFGRLFNSYYNPSKRKKFLLSVGFSMIAVFLGLRVFNIYGDVNHWSFQKNNVYSLLSLLNVTKYPPSLLYTLITLGPALILLALTEKPLNSITEKIAVFGRVPFFYYVVHIYLIHLLAMMGAQSLGYNWSDMILNDRVNNVEKLKGYGFDLTTVYLVWLGLVIFLYPLCKWFDKYKRAHQSKYKWLSYL